MPLERGKSFRADMMLDSFGVHFGDAFRDTEAAEESDDSFVPAFARGGNCAAFAGQKNGAIRLRSDKAGVLQTGDGAIDSDVSDAESFGEVNDTRLTDFRNEIGDGLDVVLGDFVGVFAPSLGEVLGLSLAACVRICCHFARCHRNERMKPEIAFAVERREEGVTKSWG
jgi:hypothetical protein